MDAAGAGVGAVPDAGPGGRLGGGKEAGGVGVGDAAKDGDAVGGVAADLAGGGFDGVWGGGVKRWGEGTGEEQLATLHGWF